MAQQSLAKSPNGDGPSRVVDRAAKPKRRRSPIARAELVTRPPR
jgi:hypothetical protein